MTWDDLEFWKSGEYQVIEERLDDLDKAKVLYNPSRSRIKHGLHLTPFDSVRVVIVGQDPYPDHRLATGLAFSIPEDVKQFPPTLQILFKEYSQDLGLPIPTTGDLTPWARQGVLLWNAIPTCVAGKSLSHEGWFEWQDLTKEIITSLCNDRDRPESNSQIVFVFLGSKAREFVKYVTEGNEVIETSHPSPRALLSSKSPILGSRLFSTINAKIVSTGNDPIEWRLP